MSIAERPVHSIPFRRAAEFLWNETEGRMFQVYFKKRTDGSMRKMTCRRDVKVGLKGGELPYKPKPKLLLPVFDMLVRDPNDSCRRMVPLDGLVSFNIGGETFILA